MSHWKDIGGVIGSHQGVIGESFGESLGSHQSSGSSGSHQSQERVMVESSGSHRGVIR